ncbi:MULTISPECIES: asparagine synthetase A [Kosmotoga]|uniref:tRNA synthetase class II (D K and N) n=1 Tax=Kosmotoga olearia (strain ATCC BAA-1733 / DSM 21960 / TBF 19.5.1) TaxID=521045 RepID=C5CG14_KOSOT|nr:MULTISPECIES: asparagine synthetase A [Kosmotoga]ACR80508.1 tRNA synthetase class II (D K and N) [Kosmotoga olearia TBF 19.5.1]OAA19630.1 asparagine synthetase [Kosmotoga sp. DU53]
MMKGCSDRLEMVRSYLVDETYRDALLVQSELLKGLRETLDAKGFVEILPVILSPITDPLNHEVFDASVEYYGQNYAVTKSMILHKQISVLVHEKIYSVSPNVRLETADKADSGRHLFEFVQLDMEVAGASRDEIMDVMEDAIIYAIRNVLSKYPWVKEKYHPTLKVPAKPFKRITVKEAVEKYGEAFESGLSKDIDEPVWLIDIPLLNREFYDKQDPERPDVLLDFDLIYPEGFGEGISGGEREHEYEQIIRRMKLKGTSPEEYTDYLELAKQGVLKPSAGCGIGIERFTRYVMGLEHVRQTRLFAKVPGESAL